ncbi:MAG TPA: cell wall hydrolase, partial [Salinarimonas sp.]|nr:cell wall hydrolase [Salinarimonas sp.]
MRWVCATVAPWALGAGLLVSFTASAVNDPNAGIGAWSAVTPLMDAAPVLPPAARLIGPSFVLPELPGFDREARPRLDGSSTPAEDPGEPLRADRKVPPAPDPVVDRARKGDPLVPLRPSLSRRGSDLAPALDPTSRHLFAPTVDGIVPLAEGPLAPPDPDAEPRLEPLPGMERTTTHIATSARSPEARAQGSTGSGRAAAGRRPDGGTPSVPRALALSSTTPAAADATPVVIAMAPTAGPAATPRADGGVAALPKGDGARPRYADLIDPDRAAREQRCLAEAVYFEARSEPEEG